MKIRITGCSKHTYWYSDKVGHVFDVSGDMGDQYLVDHNGDKTLFCVDKTDCKVIETTNPTELINNQKQTA